ncbi:MAG: hypothetical protein VX627_06390 [Candidatus Thermoplasmatota archaeon]|nr:hypothetical protein [Candidatus Thermoplasmatota archaeon]
MTDGINQKGALAELVGSLAVTLLVFGETGWDHGTAAQAGAAGVALAIMWMTFKGSEILPILTIGNMASGRTDWQTGALNFCMQVLGALIASGVLFWQASQADGSVFSAGEELGATGAVTALLGGFLMMTVWDRLGGGWESGAFAAILILAGVTLASASSLGGMIVESGWTQDNFVNILGTLIVGGIGSAGALMLSDELFEEE